MSLLHCIFIITRNVYFVDVFAHHLVALGVRVAPCVLGTRRASLVLSQLLLGDVPGDRRFFDRYVFFVISLFEELLVKQVLVLGRRLGILVGGDQVSSAWGLQSLSDFLSGQVVVRLSSSRPALELLVSAASVLGSLVVERFVMFWGTIKEIENVISDVNDLFATLHKISHKIQFIWPVFLHSNQISAGHDDTADEGE